MARSILILSLTIYLIVKGVPSKPIEEISFTEGINFRYENDEWICGDVTCPANTFGCKIVLKNSEEEKTILYQSFNCFDKDKVVTLGAGDRIELTKEKKIEIDLETYVGAKSLFTTGYGSGQESTKGVIAVDELHALKETAKRNKKFIEDINAQLQH